MKGNNDWRSVAMAAQRLGVSARQVRYLIERKELRAKSLNPRSRRVTWLVYWPDVVRYDEGRDARATA